MEFQPILKREEEKGEKPLVIIGGGREIPEGHELYITDDSSLHPSISSALRKFLPNVYPGKFKEGQEPDMEWVRFELYSI